MWIPHKLERAMAVPVGSPLGCALVEGVVADGLVLVNACALLDWRRPSVHAEACAECGEPGCGGPDRIGLRHVAGGLGVLPLPSGGAARIRDGSCGCPALEKGVVLLTEEQCRELGQHGLRMHAPSRYPDLAGNELVTIVCWDAPPGLLISDGTRIRIARDSIYACSEGSVESCVEFVESLLNATYSSRAAFLRRPREGARRLTFFIGEPSWSEWSPCAFFEGAWHFCLSDAPLLGRAAT